MRKLIFAINLTLDGCCDHTKGVGSEDIHTYFTQLLREAGVLVYGRKTYQLMVPFWPELARSGSGTTQTMNDFARAFAAVEQIVVFSRTLERVEDKNTRLVRSDLREEILRLKREPGKDLLAGGVDLPTQLIELGLVDEYRIVVQPFLAGEGRRLLDTARLQDRLHLKLVDTQTLASGSVALRYSKA